MQHRKYLLMRCHTSDNLFFNSEKKIFPVFLVFVSSILDGKKQKFYYQNEFFLIFLQIIPLILNSHK